MQFRLRDQSVLLRLAAMCFLLMILLGYWASMRHMQDHLGPKDGDPDSVSYEDVAGHYVGVEVKAPLLRVLDDPSHDEYFTEEAREVLEGWLARGEAWVQKGRSGADPIAAGYDIDPEDPDNLDAYTPAVAFDEQCIRCHASDAKEGTEASRAIELARLPGVQAVAYSNKISAVPPQILITSLHTHALSIPIFSLIVVLLFLATSWPRILRHGLAFLCAFGLLADLASWELARQNASLVWVIIVGGGVYGGTLCLMVLLTFIDMWFLPRSAGGT